MKIGFYDSGIGGQSIIDAITDLYPDLEYEFFVDSQFFPLGEKTVAQIQERVIYACRDLFSQGCEVVMLACNTASVNALAAAREALYLEYPGKRIEGMVEPMMDFLDSHVGDSVKRGILLATVATCSSPGYASALRQRGIGPVTMVPAPGLAEAIEIRNQSAIMNNLQTVLTPGITREIEYVLLACTHYTYAVENLEIHLGEKIRVLDGTRFVARWLILRYLNGFFDSSEG